MLVSLRTARTIIRGSLEKKREMELNLLSIVVRDVGGYLITSEREVETAFDLRSLRNGPWQRVRFGDVGYGGHGVDGASLFQDRRGWWVWWIGDFGARRDPVACS